MADANTVKKLDTADAARLVSMDGGGAAETGRKKKKKGGLRLAVLIILILAIGGFLFATMSMNLFDVRTKFFTFVHNLDPEYQSIEEQQSALDKKQAELDSKEARLASTEESLNARKAGLNELEDNLNSQALYSVPIYRRPISEDDIEYMESIGRIFSSMQPLSAASILQALYTTEDMAAILYYMSESSAAGIMELMEVTQAAAITDVLLHQ